MKKSLYIAVAMAFTALTFQSCEDLEEVKPPGFEVEFNQTAKVGEAVVFNIKDAPNFLSFYSGEFTHEYKKSNRLKAKGEFSLSFETARNFMDGESRSDNAWSLLASTDYNGSGKAADVAAAKWTDITSRATFATNRTYNLTSSGPIKVSDFAGDAPVYFAIRAKADGKNSEKNRQGNFRVHSFDIELAVENEDYSLPITSFNNPGFKPVNVQGTHPTNSTKDIWVNKTSYYELAADQAEYTNEDWLITNPVNLGGAVAPDRGEPLKTYSAQLKTYEYVYTTPGTYKVAFVGSNQTIDGRKEMVKEYTVTVTK